MKRPPIRVALVVSCVLGLIALALMTWSVLVPHPLQIMVAMSAGQVLGTTSLLIFAWVAVSDMIRKGALR
ncbi:hypothetical protein BH09MYX1_BH09MYX1_33570 [soil metagenome]